MNSKMQRLVPALETRNECCSCYTSFIELEKALQKANEETKAFQMRVAELEQLVMVVQDELKDANDLLLTVIASNPPSNKKRDQAGNFHSHLAKFKTKLSSRKLVIKPSHSSARQVNKQGSWRPERSSRSLVVDRIQRTTINNSSSPSNRIVDGPFLQMVSSDNIDKPPAKSPSNPPPVKRKDTSRCTSKNPKSSHSSNLTNGTSSADLISSPIDNSSPRSKKLHSQSSSLSSSLSPPCVYLRSIHRRLSTSLVIDGVASLYR